MANVVFFDLVGTLVLQEAGGAVPAPGAGEWLRSAGRAGLLCNAAPGSDPKRVAEEAGVLDLLDPALLVNAAALPCPLPDRRAFAVAAALAEAPVSECVYVSSDTSLLIAAAAAGMGTVRVAPDGAAPAQAPTPAQAGPVEVRTPGPRLLADDRPQRAPAAAAGPTFVLAGRAVTMAASDGVVDDARVCISRGRVVAVTRPGKELPQAFAERPVIETGGTIYPGLIDLHNHFVYNVLPLWQVPQPYENRSQWPRHPDYASTVTLPVRALAAFPPTARALVRYVEGKALIGAVTTGQGIRTKVEGGSKLFRGAMRNVEEPDDPSLPAARTRVPDLYPNPEGIASFKRGLDATAAYFYHLAEGVDARAHQRFTDLKTHDLIKRSLVAIHALGLEAADLAELRAAGAKVVWSPFSNLLLYGSTLDPAELKASGVTFSIGCDWSPTGSKNLLEELKVARHVADGAFSSEELVRAVTVGAAEVVGWHQQLGSLRDGAFADLVVLSGADGDPYDALIDSGEADVELVITEGIPRYGARELMDALHPERGRPLEELTVAGKPKAFDLFAPGSTLNDVTFAGARDTLAEAMADLPGLRERANEEGAKLNSLGIEVPEFVVELDNEYVPTPEELQEFGGDPAGLMADWTKLAHSVPLDPPEVGADDYWERIDGQSNIDQGLKTALREAYGG